MNRPEPEEEPEVAAETGCLSFQTVEDRRRERRYIVWMLAATLAYVAASGAPRWWPETAVPTWLGLGLVLALGFQTLCSYLQYLRGADELLRRLQLEALAIGFGAGIVFSICYPLFEPLGAPHAGARSTAVVMMVVWSLGSLLGPRRYSARRGP